MGGSPRGFWSGHSPGARPEGDEEPALSRGGCEGGGGVLDLLASIRVADVIDILLVAYIVYRILLLIRGTRAVQIITGLALLFGVFLVSRQFGLLTFQWLVGNFLAYIIVIMVILFQNEIRAGLARIGQARFIRSRSEKDEEVLEEIISAIIELSARKRGAILVLERTIGLKDISERGIPVDGKVTRDLILSITHPDSPLHDGAIIISGDRVAAAGVILPINQEVMSLPLRGARHRAALSITYDSDAVSVVISEENGEITLYVEKMEKKVATGDELRLLLYRLFGRRREEKGEESEGEEKPVLSEEEVPEEGKTPAGDTAK
ncbi:MAG: TIGR00159 family protein [Deltaproteobacteria bacterium]|nr:MAG: TIGR00159 family protein [Deltaproteobacteria bacterium]